jgi:hypothetical protein
MKKIIILFLLLNTPIFAQIGMIAASGGRIETSDWKRPTGDTDDQWTNSENAYDGSLETYANCSTNGQSVTFTIAALSCSKIRVYAGRVAGGEADLDIDVYYSGEFHNIHSGTLTEDTWVEIEIGSTQTVTSARVTTGDGINSAVHEINFYDAG